MYIQYKIQIKIGVHAQKNLPTFYSKKAKNNF